MIIDNFQDKIYYSSPVWLQNLLVSAYGVSLRHKRYGKGTREQLEFLLSNESKNREELYEIQQLLFVKTAKAALSHVPFYRSWAAEHHIHPGDIRGLEALSLFPILDKETVRENPLNFYDERYLSSKSAFFLSTSGTTGTPLKILTDSLFRTKHYAFWSRIRAWFGLSPIPRRATLFGRIIMLPETDAPPFWRYDLVQKNLLLSSYHLSENNLGFYVKKLVDYNPDELIGYPSSLYHLALYIVARNLGGMIHPKVVFTTAENLLPYQKSVIFDAFRCPVINQYGCTEMAMFASECEHGRLHLHPEHGFVEVLSPTGKTHNGGGETVTGEMICTGFVNTAMPLLRYRLGDEVSLNRSMKCPCGRMFPVIEEVEGRCDDIIKTPDGRPIGRLDPVFKGFAGIKECQIVQESLLKVTVNIVCDVMFSTKVEEELLNEFRKRLGKLMEIKIIKMDSIPRTSGGKFRPVISHLKNNNGVDQ